MSRGPSGIPGAAGAAALALALVGCGVGAEPAGSRPDAPPGVRADGHLVVIGGALDADNGAVYGEVLAGRDGEGPVCVLPTASGVPEQSMASAVAALDTHGGPGSAVGVFLTEGEPGRARLPAVADSLRACSGFFFTGGDQSRIVDFFLPAGDTTVAYRAVMDRYREGAVVAGTSAGAAMMGRRVIAGGSSAEALAEGAVAAEGVDGVWIREGMGFVDGVLLDQHFLARGRVGRLLVAVLAEPGVDAGIGVDENTALVVEGGRGRVVGASGAVIVDARGATRDDAGQAGRGLRVTLAGDGDAVDLATLAVEPGPGKRPLAAAGPPAVPDDPFARWAFLHLVAAAAAAPDAVVEVPGDGYTLRLRRADGFRALARSGTGVEGTPAGLSAGPFEVDLVAVGG